MCVLLVFHSFLNSFSPSNWLNKCMTAAPLCKDMVAAPSPSLIAVALWSALSGSLGGSVLTHLLHTRAGFGRSPAVGRDRVNSRGNAVIDVESVGEQEEEDTQPRRFLSSSPPPGSGSGHRSSTTTPASTSSTSSSLSPLWMAWDDAEPFRHAYLAGSLLLHAGFAGCWIWWWCAAAEEPKRRKSIRARLIASRTAAGESPTSELRHVRSRVGP